MYGQPSYYPNPAMTTAQQRLQQMEQQYPQFNPQNQQGQQNMMPQQWSYPQQPTPILKGRPVASFDEAKASMIDLDGSVYFFTDMANRAIYTKQINLDGTATLNTYKLQEPEKIVPSSADTQPEQVPVTQTEFNSTIKGLEYQISAIKAQLEGGIPNADKPNADDVDAKRKK